MDLDSLVSDLDVLVERYLQYKSANEKLQEELQSLQDENIYLSLKQEQTHLILRNVLGQLNTLREEGEHAIR